MRGDGNDLLTGAERNKAMTMAHEMTVVATAADFDEEHYLAANADVRAAVRAGTFRSGWEHFVRFGDREGRRMTVIGRAIPGACTTRDIFEAFVAEIDPAVALAAAQNDFESAFYAQTDRISNKWHHYLSIYDRHLRQFRGTGVRLLEIGVREGGSLQVWRRYLGPHALIRGLDIDPACAGLIDERAEIVIGSQADHTTLVRVVEEMGGVDVVIDDGSHFWWHQILTFETLFPMLVENGVYICEDTHSSYWPTFAVDRPDSPSFIEYAKSLVDHLHARYRLDGRRENDEAFARRAQNVLFYDSMVVIERGPGTPPQNVSVGSQKANGH